MRGFSALLLISLISFVAAATAPLSEPVSGEATVLEQEYVRSQNGVVHPEIEKIISGMSLRQRVGQMFIFGFVGQEIDRGLTATIRALNPGGIIIFGRNIRTAKQLAQLNYEAQKLSLREAGAPLLIAVDQEGGNVIRIKTSPPLPSALALGGTEDTELVRSAGYHTGVLLKALGFNMNLAPVLDVSDPKRDSFIGTRTFGGDALTVKRMGQEFAAGLWDAGVLPTAKHFPGHGGVSEDSHRGTPAKTITLEQMLAQDLVPFQPGSSTSQNWAVMLAHIAYPKIDATQVPATFSKVIVGDLLRKRMRFEGLVMTDDIEMAGAFAIKDVRERSIRAVEAGVDLVMVGWNKSVQTAVIESLEAAVRSGRIPEERINESLRRILETKRRTIGFASPQRPEKRLLADALRNSKLKEIAERTVEMKFSKSLTRFDGELVKDNDRVPILVFSASDTFAQSFKNSLKKRDVRTYRLQANSRFDINRVMRSNPTASAVFYLTGPQSASHANRIAEDVARRIFLINAETQALLTVPEKFRHIVDVHFKHPRLGELTSRYFFKKDTMVPAVRSPASASTF